MAQEINWKTWKLRGIAKVWEASLLTLGIDPRPFEDEPIFLRDYGPTSFNIRTRLPGKTLQDYEDRTKELEAAIRLEEIEAEFDGRLQTLFFVVRLVDIAQWAKKHNVEKIPTELLEMINDAGEVQAVQQTYPGKSDKLAYLNQASQKFWGKFDPERPAENSPLQSEVVDWLKAKGFSPSLATKGASIITPDSAPKGRRPKQ
jgi:hypothetical protein